MRRVTEYLRCEQACRDLASMLTKADDKHALKLMAACLGSSRPLGSDHRKGSPQPIVHTSPTANCASPAACGRLLPWREPTGRMEHRVASEKPVVLSYSSVCSERVSTKWGNGTSPY